MPCHVDVAQNTVQAAKKEKKEEDEEDLAFKAKKKAEADALKAARDKGESNSAAEDLI